MTLPSSALAINLGLVSLLFFNLMKVKVELSRVPGVSDLSGRRVQWGVMKILRGALGGHELHDTISR